MGRSILNLPEASTSDKLAKVHYHKYSTRHGVSESANGGLWLSSGFTTTTSNATLIIRGQIWARHNASDTCGIYCQLLDNSNNNAISGADNQDGSRYWGIGYSGVNTGTAWAKFLLSWHQIYTGVDAGTYKVKIGWSTRDGTTGNRPFSDWNINSGDDARSRQHDTTCQIWELEDSEGLTNTNLSIATW